MAEQAVGYLTFPDSPWLQISIDRIQRIDYPPLELPSGDPTMLIRRRRAIRVVTDTGERWSDGDRSWFDRKEDAAIAQATVELDQAVATWRDVMRLRGGQ